MTMPMLPDGTAIVTTTLADLRLPAAMEPKYTPRYRDVSVPSGGPFTRPTDLLPGQNVRWRSPDEPPASVNVVGDAWTSVGA